MSQVALERHGRPEAKRAWQVWIAENLLQGVDPQMLVAALAQRGVTPSTAIAHIRATLASPIFKAAERVCGNRQKMAWLLDALSAQYRQSGYADDIPVRDDLSAAEFYDRYYFANRPVIVRGLMSNWDALTLWTPEYFGFTFGDCEVEITSNRNADARYEDNFAGHRSMIRMREYARMVRRDDTNDYYLVAKNNLLERDEFKPLFGHFTCPPDLLDPANVDHHHVRMWLGPKGTVTPLHHDACNILFGQVYGRKRVQLISPYDINKVYNDRECFSAVDLEEIDYDKFPRMLDVSIIDVVIEPGDFILLPIGWWHWVRALDASISLTFTNFAIDGNTVVWKYR